MLFRKRLFTILAVICVVYLVGGFATINSAVNSTIEDAPSTSNENSRAAYAFGAGLGGLGGTGVLLCTGLPLFFLFSLLAWRNSAGLRTERRHQEQLAAAKGQYD